jgi:hypothetical protein
VEKITSARPGHVPLLLLPVVHSRHCALLVRSTSGHGAHYT